MVTLYRDAPAALRLAPRRLWVQVHNTNNTTLLGVWPDVANEIIVRQSIGSQDRLELLLPRRVGRSRQPLELDTDGSLALSNYLRVYLADARTLANAQADSGSARTGSTATDLGRLMWTGIIRATGERPAGYRVAAVGQLGAAAGSPQTYLVPYAALLDWELETSDYRTPGTAQYTGWILVSHELFDTSAIKLGDNIRVLGERVFNPDNTSRVNAYEDSARQVYSIEWSLEGLRVTFDARDPDLINNQLTKLTPVTINSAGDKLTSTAEVQAAGLKASGDPLGVSGTITYSNQENTATPRGAGVGTIKFADGTPRDSTGFVKVQLGLTVAYVPVFAAN